MVVLVGVEWGWLRMGRYVIKLEKPDGAYSAGDVVRGRVLHEVLEPEETLGKPRTMHLRIMLLTSHRTGVPVLGITITCLGRSTVEFEIAVETSAHRFSSDETCLRELIFLVGDPMSGKGSLFCSV